jgi:hypothetical protein
VVVILDVRREFENLQAQVNAALKAPSEHLTSSRRRFTQVSSQAMD